MRVIAPEIITKAVKDLYLDLNFNLNEDVSKRIKTALSESENEVEKYIISCLIKNEEIAAENKIALCQDTGMAVIFAEYGDEICAPGFENAVNEGVRRAYAEGCLRKSIVSEPVFDRKNTGDNTPAIIHIKSVSGDKLKLTVGAKGFGSENMSKMKMFNPTASVDEICDFVVNCVKEAGPNPCPPVVVGVGIGGDFEMAALLSKKATFRSLDEPNGDNRYAQMEKEILSRINKLNIGCGGYGGNTTALGVNIEYYPTHIAGLPVAVNISCHSTRHKSCII